MIICNNRHFNTAKQQNFTLPSEKQPPRQTYELRTGFEKDIRFNDCKHKLQSLAPMDRYLPHEQATQTRRNLAPDYIIKQSYVEGCRQQSARPTGGARTLKHEQFRRSGFGRTPLSGGHCTIQPFRICDTGMLH